MSLVVTGNKVGVGTSAPFASTLSVKGSVSIGTTYATTAAPTDGLLVEGTTKFGSANEAGYIPGANSQLLQLWLGSK